jgi:hypothetical protein
MAARIPGSRGIVEGTPDPDPQLVGGDDGDLVRQRPPSSCAEHLFGRVPGELGAVGNRRAALLVVDLIRPPAQQLGAGSPNRSGENLTRGITGEKVQGVAVFCHTQNTAGPP